MPSLLKTTKISSSAAVRDSRPSTSKNPMAKFRIASASRFHRRRSVEVTSASTLQSKRASISLQRTSDIYSPTFYPVVYASPLTKEQLRQQKKRESRQPVLEMVADPSDMW
ncbi:hypothetical protein HIM_04200 [Hirsutella minnesotensis 3608]|uniref:Uncharacterized protein n=1 Tax=Hirsutella minnesotensis 3608 TaxID=1043627 RepID=A0A0F7ZLJ1_9HYPO|nr:hypothetical protein HIM_04200 [Hirsutella minnesotensis 3608]